MLENIPQETLAEILQLGGQYFLPIAALLRALYSGIRQKFPEGFLQIGVASVFAGLTAIVGNQQLDLRAIILEIMGNTVFMAGLLSFIFIYLLRQPDRGFIVDAVIGGILGGIFWAVWVLILGNDWPWWMIPVTIAAGAVGFILLRMALRVISTLVKLATVFIVIGLLAVVVGGGFLLLQTLTGAVG
jgi:hypothetical protein